MVAQAEQVAGPPPRGGAGLDFDTAVRSVFDATLFIAAAEVGVRARAAGPDRTWQAAVGRRLLTPAEEAARARHFERRAAAAAATLDRAAPPVGRSAAA